MRAKGLIESVQGFVCSPITVPNPNPLFERVCLVQQKVLCTVGCQSAGLRPSKNPTAAFVRQQSNAVQPNESPPNA